MFSAVGVQLSWVMTICPLFVRLRPEYSFCELTGGLPTNRTRRQAFEIRSRWNRRGPRRQLRAALYELIRSTLT
jgi:hypothetical protein